MELKKLPNYHNYITKKASETNRLPLLLTINKYTSFLVELEIVLCVVVRDILNHTRKALHIVRKQSLFNIVTQEVAKQSSEVLMTRIAQE